MNSDLQQLIHLQELDLVAERLRRRVAEMPAARAALDARIASRTEAVDAVKQRVAANHASRRDIERDLAAVQGRLSKFKNQLMEVKTNKEYQAMQKEIAMAEADVSSQETRTLECMEEADTLAVELKSAEAALKADKTEVAREIEQLDTERSEVERKLQQTLQERQSLAAGISREALTVFERVAHGRKGLAVAEARDGLCTVCHVRLRPQVFNEVRRNDSLIQCDSCTRILYFVPAPSGATPQPQ